MPPAIARYLFDLHDDDLHRAIDRYAPGLDPALLRASMRAPFDASRFGDLEEELGRAGAEQAITGMWADVRRGVSPVELKTRFAAEIERLTDLAPPRRIPILGQTPRMASVGGASPICGVEVTAESGEHRVEVRALRVSAVLLSYGAIRVTFKRRRSNGTWDVTKADHLEAEADVYLGVGGGPVQAVRVNAAANHEKRLRAQFVYAGLAFIPFVEGCGGVSPNSPLWACACGGEREGYEGAGSTGTGNGGIVDGG